MIHILGKGAIGSIFSNAFQAHSIPHSFNIPASPAILLICVKNHQVLGALEKIPNSTQLIVLSNGSLSLNFDRFPHLIYASTSLSGYMHNGKLVQTGTLGKTLFNPFHDCPICFKTLDIFKSINQINPVVYEIPKDVDFKVKLLLKTSVNAIINPVTALTKKRNGYVDWKQYSYIADEIERIYSRKFTRYPTSREIMAAVFEVASVTSENKSSMLVDVESGRRTEIEGINGWLVKIGRECGAQTSVNQEILDRIRNLKNVTKDSHK